jgi:molybdate transport system substrate-binding protein
MITQNRSSRWSMLPAAIVVAMLLPGVACRKADAPKQQQELIVSAAVSLKDAFNEIAQISETRDKVKVRFNFGASGALQKQIEAGAPADIFASAGAKQMDDLAAKSLIVPTSRADFAGNVLLLVQPATATKAIASFNDLTKAEVKKIAVGNPKTVPAGEYTEQTFNKLKLLPDIQPKLIYAEDVRQVLDYVARGEVDAGCVYSSDVAKAGGKVKEVTRAPDDSHDPIVYPIALIKDSHNQAAAQKFVDLILSPEGQSILAKHGFVSIRR